MFELHYEYVCSAGWREHKTRTVANYSELKAVIDYCNKQGYEIMDNPLCVDCFWRHSECAGSKNHIWTGCKKRMGVNEFDGNGIENAG